MYILNIDSISKKIKVNKWISDYLIYELNFPLLGRKNNDYYFAETPELLESLDNLPLLLKIAKKL